MSTSIICFLALLIANFSISHSLSITTRPSNQVTTPVIKTPINLEEIFKARCKEYITIVNPEPFKERPKDCNRLWELFKRAFAFKPECGVKPDDFNEFISEAEHLNTLKDKVLLWSGDVYPFVIDFARQSKKYITIRDQLAVYILQNIENWCGKIEQPGINYNKCPTYSECKTNAVGSFWIQLSAHFILKAEGTVYAMFNASSKVAFNETKIFGRTELPKLNKPRVKVLHAILVGNLNGPKHETCKFGSMRKLRKLVEHKGMKFRCWDAHPSVWHLQCLKSKKGCSEASSINAQNSFFFASIFFVIFSSYF